MHMPRKFTLELEEQEGTYYGVKFCVTYNTEGEGESREGGVG